MKSVNICTHLNVIKLEEDLSDEDIIYERQIELAVKFEMESRRVIELMKEHFVVMISMER